MIGRIDGRLGRRRSTVASTRVGRMTTAGPQAVEAEPAGDDDEPALGIVEARQIGAGEAGERLLHDVLGVAEVRQHPQRQLQHSSPVGPPEASKVASMASAALPVVRS